MIYFSKRISEDVKEYKKRGVNGIVEDGSQRSFFPTGLAFYTYARTLYDVSLSADEIAKEYFDAAFGAASDEVYNYMRSISDLFDFRYMSGEMSVNEAVSPYYNPEYACRVENGIADILTKGRALVEKYYNSDERVRTVSVRLLEKHLTYCDYFARLTVAKAKGNDLLSKQIFTEYREYFGKLEYEMRPYFDNFLFFRKAESIFSLTESNLDATQI